MFDDELIAQEGLHVTGNYRDRTMQHTCSRHAAWEPHTRLLLFHLDKPPNSHRMLQFNGSRKSKSPQNLQLIVYYY